MRESWSARRRGQRLRRGEHGAPGGQRARVPRHPRAVSVGDRGGRVSPWGRGCPFPATWKGWGGGGRGITSPSTSVTLLSAGPPLPGAPLFHPSRVRQLEEELRTMDQTLKSLIASEEEVPGQGRGATCGSPPSLCRCQATSLPLCLGRKPSPRLPLHRRGLGTTLRARSPPPPRRDAVAAVARGDTRRHEEGTRARRLCSSSPRAA